MSAVVYGQSPCQIQITSVDPQAESALGGSALRVDFRNASSTPVSAISFQVLFGQRGGPVTLTEHQPLGANKAGSAQWNEAGWLTPAVVRGIRADQITVWPGTVAFEDGTVWKGSLDCAFRSSDAERVPIGIPTKNSIPVTAVVEKRARGLASTDQHSSSDTSGSLPKTAEQKMALIKVGEASLCRIRTYPEGANVDVDGKLLGHTPLSIVLLKGVNARDVFLYMTGYKVAHRAVQPNGSTLAITVTLERHQTTN